jgi:FkbM family methyltransferase
MTETYTDHSGFVWHYGGEETDDHLAFGGHEPGVIEVARALLPQDGVFLDVGAHVGLYTVNLATKASKVFAIEANPKTWKVLSDNIEANRHVLKADVFAHNFAAWDTFAELHMVDENGKQTGGSTRCVPGESEDVKKALGWTTQGLPLDEALPLAEGVKIDLVKIDVEGAEARVLKGMRKRLINDRPKLLIEMHDMYFGKQVRYDTLAILEALGYAWNDDVAFGGSYYVIATPETPDEFVVEIVRAGE